MKGDLIMGNSVWVIAFDKVTGERAAFTCCKESSSEFYKQLYEGDGYAVKVLNDNQVDELIEVEDANKRI